MFLPRLTTAIRSFSSLAADYDKDGKSRPHSAAELKYKQEQCLKRQLAEQLSWKQLFDIVHSNGTKGEAPGGLLNVDSELKHLIKEAQIIAGDEVSSESVQSAAVFLFTLFDSSTSSTLQANMKTLRQYFGSCSASDVNKVSAIVLRLRSALPAEILEKIDSMAKPPASELQNKSDYFGRTIKYTPLSAAEKAVVPDDDFSWMDSVEDGEDSSDTEAVGSGFSMKYIPPESRKDKKPRDDINNRARIGMDWLRNQMDIYFGSSSEATGGQGSSTAALLSSSVFDMLCSSKSSAELQAELFDLLGFDRFELIESLLLHRQEIITAAIIPDRLAIAHLKNEPTRPNYGCQITVQTEEEKQLLKVMRREEKKLGKTKKDGFELGSEDTGKFLLDSADLRAHREAQLLSAASAPLFSSRANAIQSVPEMYPNVYDSNLTARQSSGFVGGSKLVLPVGFERLENQKYEEVNIPPTDRIPPNVIKKLVAVEDMDEIGRVAFVGTKNLNLIQSMVYKTAYQSNENMLICAPTGAGKTNIAMLAVLRVLKQHLINGVMKKDDFKIVYVAPMKALAAEMVRNFGQRLAPLGIVVMELTGDVQLTKAEIMKTQMLVTTPEKWDVVTRKSTGDVALTQIVRLLIIDEVHLLHDDRGAVIETLVARTLRQVETSQTMIRIVGLSATLPNYLDVARFLDVNPKTGLFFFDGRFRPVPLAQSFIGIKAVQRMQQLQDFNTVCYEKVIHQVKNGHQVMVFVHARNETVRTAMVLCEMAKNAGQIMMFAADKSPKLGDALKQLSKSRNRQLRELFPDGFAIHHAGMLRSDRNLVEKYFAEGLVRCIVCTATLAWGVNLPAHAVIIKGTQIYDAKKGSFVDLGILDVMQIFGRAGRPQFDTFGHGTIITAHNKLSHYLSLLTQQNPIESQFLSSLVDNLNAEVSLGTITNVEEGVKWLQYTYLFVRMRCNPLVYGISHHALMDDPSLENVRRDHIINAGRQLDKAKMVRFDERTGYLFSTDQGRTASHFYVKRDTIEIFNELLNETMNEDKVFEMVSKAQEFDQIKIRDEEMEELDRHLSNNCQVPVAGGSENPYIIRDEEMEELDRHLSNNCQVPVAGGSENPYGKVNILLQTFISRAPVENFSLVSDQAYVAQNAARIIRALFEMALRKNWPLMSGRLLQLSKVLEKRLWAWENPLRQFQGFLQQEVLDKLEQKGLSVEKIKEMDPKEIGHMIRHVNIGPRIKECADWIPLLSVDASIQPITRTVLRVILAIKAEFRWNDRIHGKSTEPFWIWVEDPDTNHIYHSEYFMLHKKHALSTKPQSVVFTIPISEPLPSQYYVRVISDRWLGSESTFPISFQHLILPERHPPHTELLDLQPLPLSALNDPRIEALYKFTHFNPIQTQIFHVLYHTDGNVLLGAPTGSGKTVAAELAIFRIFREYPKSKAVYIAPLKALVRERMEDWKVRIEGKLGKKVVELTGDVTPDMRAVAQADLIVTTPEKWDGISRSWQTRNYVKDVTLLVIDEIHLLGNDRGPVLEVIVSRTNFIASHTAHKVRVVGLSTALANARDLADWLNIRSVGLFNFRPSVRPVPLEVHIQGFPGKHYCPRMATMNKPTFMAIRTHSPDKPVLVFVSSRRQTRLTALDLIAFLAADDNSKQWLHLPEEEMESIVQGIRESNLKLTLAYGIGIHHAGLHERDRKTVEELFVNQKIQVLIATSTLAWGVNFPAHLVVVKGTEYYDGKTKQYIDFPITDVLQMMGRAGRPQFDNQGKAVILVHDAKKHFYKKFLYEPFPVESNLLGVLPDHLNAEIVAGTISSKQEAMDYITWTYFFRRLVMNPSYYKLDDTSDDHINRFLSQIVQRALQDLEASFCVEIEADGFSLTSTTLGTIASYYYLNHLTIRNFRSQLAADSTIPDLLKILADAYEFSDLPVRHNEDHVNSELAPKLPIPVDVHTYDNSNTKTHLLLQAHFSRCPLPSADYYTDTKSVMDQALRVLQAMLDVVADQGWLVTTLRVITMLQMVIQGSWSNENTLLILPGVQAMHLHLFKKPLVRDNSTKQSGDSFEPIDCLPALVNYVDGKIERLEEMLKDAFSRQEVEPMLAAVNALPQIQVSVAVKSCSAEKAGNTELPVDKRISLQYVARRDQEWVRIQAEQEYILHISLARLNKHLKHDSRAYAPRFQKPKDEGYILVLGDIEHREVVALKRVGYVRNRTVAQITFIAPDRTGRIIYTLYVMSDCYLGLDQQYDLCFELTPPPPPAYNRNNDDDDDDGNLLRTPREL